MKPLVSFCLKSYNGRRYLREALNGVFSQTYRPLEIVISDDASTDGSWEIIQEEVKRRDLGDGVSVHLNRNQTNLGNLGNWERLCELAHGELLVKADGDDISLPERTERIVDAWLANGKRAMVICHSGWQIGKDGEKKGRIRNASVGAELGAAMAFARCVYQTFGPSGLDPQLPDDAVYVRRALMLGPSLEISDRLVRYRLGSGVSSNEWNLRDRMRFYAEGSVRVAQAMLTWLERQGASVPASEKWRLRFQEDLRQGEARLALVGSRRLRERLAAARVRGPVARFGVTGYLRMALLMPRVIGSPMLFGYVLMRNVLRRTGVL